MAKVYECVVLNPVKITSSFGKRKDPVTGKENVTHAGIDVISENKNNKKEIYAAYDGVVLSTVTNQSNAKTGYGNTIWIRHPELGYSTFYAHLKTVKVKKGQKVKKGDVIAIMGSTGKSTGTHLHLGVQYIGKSQWQDPKKFEVPDDKPAVIKPVNRDENKNQIKVITSQLRIRKNHNTTSDIIGMSEQNKIYDYYEIYKDDKYTWYKLADEQWIADNGKYLEVYSKREGEDEEVMIEELKKEIEDYKKQLDVKNEVIAQKEAKIEELSSTLNNLSKNYKPLYTAPKNGYYKVYLKELETLYLTNCFK